MASAVLMLGLLSGCATAYYSELPATEIGKAPEPYRLDAGDKLRITVYREPELSGEFPVVDTGRISMPLIGDVAVKGKTSTEVEAELTRRFADGGLLRDPKVAVSAYDYRTFAILGEVQRPGIYPAREGTTLTDAVAQAGGYTYRAQEKRILIRRGNKGPYYWVNVDADVTVKPGDALRVEEIHF